MLLSLLLSELLPVPYYCWPQQLAADGVDVTMMLVRHRGRQACRLVVYVRVVMQVSSPVLLGLPEQLEEPVRQLGCAVAWRGVG